MINASENVLRAIDAIERGTQSELFEEIIKWLKASRDKETNVAIYDKDDTERKFASGRVQELRFILKVLENEET